MQNFCKKITPLGASKREFEEYTSSKVTSLMILDFQKDLVKFNIYLSLQIKFLIFLFNKKLGST